MAQLTARPGSNQSPDLPPSHHSRIPEFRGIFHQIGCTKPGRRGDTSLPGLSPFSREARGLGCPPGPLRLRLVAISLLTEIERLHQSSRDRRSFICVLNAAHRRAQHGMRRGIGFVGGCPATSCRRVVCGALRDHVAGRVYLVRCMQHLAIPLCRVSSRRRRREQTDSQSRLHRLILDLTKDTWAPWVLSRHRCAVRPGRRAVSSHSLSTRALWSIAGGEAGDRR